MVETYRPDNDYPTAPPTGSAPPVHAGDMTVEPTNKWPIVIGVIAIIFAAAALLLGLWGLVATPFMPTNMFSEGQREIMEKYQPAMIALNIATVALAALLLIGAIRLIMRAAAARKLILAWACLKILLVVANVAVALPMQQASLADAQQQGAVMPPGFEAVFAAGFVCVGIGWGIALPVFMLIWFSRPSVREEVASWRRPGDEASWGQ